MGIRKTCTHILRHFFWPRLKHDVSTFVKTCDTCQLTSKPNQAIAPAPLCPIPAIRQPMEYCMPPSKSGSQYLLTVMCQTTRYPAAYPLRSITAKALTQFISVFGIPKVVQSDRGLNFTSKLFALQQLKIKHNLASAYHPESQGALDHFHQTLKSLLHSFCTELSRRRAAMVAACGQGGCTGFNPNNLVFGHTVHRPLAVLQSECQPSEPPQYLLDYANGFRYRLYVAGQLAKEKLHKAQKKMKTC